jgi:hypothetical protein
MVLTVRRTNNLRTVSVRKLLILSRRPFFSIRAWNDVNRRRSDFIFEDALVFAGRYGLQTCRRG